SVADVEAMVKIADAANKPMFEQILADAKKNLKTAENPNNKTYAFFAKNYETLAKDYKQNNEAQLANWENKYPANHLLYVKVRLQEFLNETKDIDFGRRINNKKR
ncbi:MAG: hypothetical protein ABIN89_20095, partial [Chitinophagaceae bacterium]